ncbi:hypothetical protein Taro_053975 [Colocasia esculenta]|uniref:Uncharacterized protein n=1 Tax=Colocasia esculenta TaxID=4460 RepID=A0A843XPP4_COLES|nr:hypothetical protein [Colocasia esculenta]
MKTHLSKLPSPSSSSQIASPSSPKGHSMQMRVERVGLGMLEFRSPVLEHQSVVAPARVASRPRGVSEVRGGFVCRPSTLWRSEVAVLMVRRRSHLVVAWSRRVCQGLLSLVPDSVGFCGSRTISSNPSGSSDLWVATQISGSLAGVRGRVVTVGIKAWVCGFAIWFVCVLQEGCTCCCVVCVASVVAQCVRAMVARLVVDSLAVVFPMWRTVAGKSGCGAPSHLRRIWVCVCLCGCESLRVVWPSPVQSCCLWNRWKVSLPCWLPLCCWGVYCVGCVWSPVCALWCAVLCSVGVVARAKQMFCVPCCITG